MNVHRVQKRKKNRRLLFDRRKTKGRKGESIEINLTLCSPKDTLNTTGTEQEVLPDNSSDIRENAITVLSVFDGIGTGLHVLDKLGIAVESYFSCEIDAAALDVQNCNFRERIQRLGSITSVTTAKLHSLGKINLLLGGSPCEELSLVNHRRTGLYNPCSTGILFFEFVRILSQLRRRASSENYPFYWLFENVCHMENNTRDTITRFLGCSHVKVHGAAFADMSRDRYFWGNVPGLAFVNSTPTQHRLTLQDALEPNRSANVCRVPTLTTSVHSQMSGKLKELPVVEEGKPTTLLVCEEERLFGFPADYTRGHDLSKTARVRLLGKFWSVHVVTAIMQGLKEVLS